MSMSRRRKGAKNQPYAIRWHSYSDITTPSADIMSSPDPLNDTTTDVVMMPSSVSRAPRSVTRSILSDRFASRESSPRKQTFELEVGDNAAPQRLFVTVETEGAPANVGANGTRRKLFQSPSPMPSIRKRERATTTTVPLRDTIEDLDSNATPRRRGRPRKTNGTPVPSAGTKRRAGTPIKRTPRRPRTTENNLRDEEPTPQPTPGSKRRGRPPKNRNLEPSDEQNTDPSRETVSATKEKRRRALSPEKSLEGTWEEPELPLNFDTESHGENDVTLVTLPSETVASEGPAPAAAEPASEGESDIWMATLDDGPTPRARTATQSGLAPSSPGLGADSPQMGDFGYFPPAASDVSSADEQLSDFGPTGGDTIAQGEDFSMIFMDSLPTLRSSVQAPVEADFGEETSLIINNTLESLRESLRKSQRRDEQSEDADTTRASERTPRPSDNFRFFDSEPAEPEHIDPEPNNPEHTEPTHTRPEYIEQRHIDPLEENETEHIEPPKDIESEHAVPEELQHDELQVAEPELAQFEASEPEDIEPQHIAPDDMGPEHPETAPPEIEHAQPERIEIEQVEPEHTGIEQLDPEQPESEDTDVDMDQTVFERARSDSSESDLIVPEPTQLQEIEIEYIEPEHVEIERTEPKNFEPEQIQHRRFQTELDVSDLEDDEPIQPHPISSPSVETRPLNTAPAEPTESESQPIIRPPFPLSPSRNLSPRWLRSPRRGASSPLRHQLLKFKARQTEDTPPRATGDGPSMPALSSPDHRESPLGSNERDSNMYDDSFSEIPQDVLEAATPHRSRTRQGEVPATEVEDEEDEEMEDSPPSQQTEEQDAPAEDGETSALTQTESARLPTPDDTPPQIEDETDEQVKPTQESQASARSASQESSSPLVHKEQSLMVPEIVEEMVDDDEEIPEILNPQGQSLSLDNLAARPEVTPVNQMTSPLQDPHSLAPEMLQEKISRPLLSPIVRAGRALQSVTSDPPSPEPREHQLRSPFRSSVTRELGPPGLEAQSGVRSSISPRRALAFSMANQPQAANPVYEDPFGSDPRHTGQLSFMEALERSSGKPTPQTTNESLVDSPASSMRISPPRDAEMSWIAEEGPISANLRGDVPLEELAQHTNAENPTSVVSHAMSDADDVDMDAENASQVQDDETDIWEFEAKRATPRATRQQPFGTRRRGQPSPWAKQSAEKPQQDEPSNQRQNREELHADQESVSDADRTEEALQEEDQVEEFSLLPQKELGNNTNKDQAPKSATKASRFDLSSFFSSPALIPGMIADKLLPAKTRSVFGARPSEPEPEMIEAAPVLPTSSMFPQVAHKELQPRAGPRKDLFSPIRAKQPNSREDGYSSLPEDVEEEPELPSIAQKKNFTPQPSQPNTSFFKSSTRSGVPTPPRMQLSHADIQRWQQETSAASDDSPEVRRPILRPLPPKNASPIKSSLRSPLKPHTPGRVVEFTSNVLSPVEQAKVRQMRRLSNSSAASQASSLVPQRPPPRMTDKENHRAPDTSVSDSSPGDKSPTPEPLSQTAWTRQHWLYMDELLQLRRAGPYELSYERRTEKFLGKTVKSHGEAMKLERWHLDCVDAFKAEVGGWDEAILVKRLFALIMGEERRSRGINDSPARLMFH